MPYVGWTYEVYAEAEVIYTNANPDGWLVEHTWTYDPHPIIEHSGRGGFRDWFMDFRFQKVLELEDANTSHYTNVQCSVRDVRFPEWDIRMEDNDDVGFLIGGVDYHPDDLAVIHLRDLVIWETAGAFGLFFDIEEGWVNGSFELELVPDPDTPIPSYSFILTGTGTDGTDSVASSAMEFNNARFYIDGDPYKYVNKWQGTENETLLAQLVAWAQVNSGKVAFVYDDAYTAGDLSPVDRDTEYGMRTFIENAIGPAGTTWDIINHHGMTEAECDYDERWLNYTMFVYVDRFGEKKHKLNHVISLVNSGAAALAVLGKGENSVELMEETSDLRFTYEFTGTHSIGSKSDKGHPIIAGLSDIKAEERTIPAVIEDINVIKDIDYIDNHKKVIPDEDMVTVDQYMFQMNDNDQIEPNRRVYYAQIKNSSRINLDKSTTRAKITIIDDDYHMASVDTEAISIDNTHVLGDTSMHESFVFGANQWFTWDNTLYTDLSANKYTYGLAFPHCGTGNRSVEATVVVHNQSSENLIGKCFNSDFTISAGGKQEFTETANRYAGSDGTGSFGWVTFDSPNEQQWKVDFRFEDYNECPGEPVLPRECGGKYYISPNVSNDVNYKIDVPEKCNFYRGWLTVPQCGEDRHVDCTVKVKNPNNYSMPFRVTTRDGVYQESMLATNGGETSITVNGRFPIEELVPDGEIPWLVNFSFDRIAELQNIPDNMVVTASYVDNDWCLWLGDADWCETVTPPDISDSGFGAPGFTLYLGDFSSSIERWDRDWGIGISSCNAGYRNLWSWSEITGIRLPRYENDPSAQKRRMRITLSWYIYHAGFKWEAWLYPRNNDDAPNNPFPDDIEKWATKMFTADGSPGLHSISYEITREHFDQGYNDLIETFRERWYIKFIGFNNPSTESGHIETQIVAEYI